MKNNNHLNKKLISQVVENEYVNILGHFYIIEGDVVEKPQEQSPIKPQEYENTFPSIH